MKSIKGEQKKVNRRNICTPVSLFSILLLFQLCLFSVHSAAAQTIPVAVLPFAGEDPAVNSRMRELTIMAVERLVEFAPRQVDWTSQPDMPPILNPLEELPYVLTGEYYFDTEDLQHLQLWLWNSESGRLVYTDELVAEDRVEAEGYLPPLVAWLFSSISTVRAPEEEEMPEEEVIEIAEAEEPVVEAEEPAAEAVEPAAPEEKVVKEKVVRVREENPLFPRLYLGLRGGGGLDMQTIRPSGGYGGGGQSFGGEVALTIEFRPWRFLSFQSEGVFALESFFAYGLKEDGFRTNDAYQGMYLLLPLLIKVPLGHAGFSLSPLAGPYFLLPLRKTMEGASYQDETDLPLGIIVGLDAAYPLEGGRFGEIYGSLRYGFDLGLNGVEETGLYYNRSRLILSVGWKMMVMGRNGE